MSYTQLSYHIVIRTHRSGRTLFEAHERDLYGYMFGFNRNHEVVTYRIGGMPDHVHLLVGLPATLAVSKYVQELKKATSRWLGENPDFPAFEGWTREYAAFTVSSAARESVTRYIRGQKEHHRAVPLEEELRRLLAENHVVYKEEYFMKD